MINPEVCFYALKEQEVTFFAGVPDSLLKNICSYITDYTDRKDHVIAANEGNALALGIGYHLATGKVPLVYMQNSGLGNIVNPLLSLADPDVYAVPLLLMIGWRGEPNVKDEPQHKKQGRISIELLEAMEVPYQVISPETEDAQINEIIKKSKEYALNNNTPYALLVRKGSFSDYKLQTEHKANHPLMREDALKLVIRELGEKDIVVSTTGVASRELFELREGLGHGHERDFLTVGGMGHANQIALGIALQKPDRQVFCLDGDGAVLMHMGALPITASMDCKNFKHILFNNAAHDSVGGQPTVGGDIDVTAIAKACGYKKVMQATTSSEIMAAIKELRSFEGTAFLEIKVNKGFRKNLGRPTKTPLENKTALMEFIQQ